MSVPPGSVGSTTTNAGLNAGRKLSGSLAGKGVGIAATLAALWLMRESYNGAKDEWVEHYQAFEDEANMGLWREGRGDYSGQPAMDRWALQLKEFMTYGIAGTRLTYYKWKMHTEGMINDVILPNLFPLSIAAGGAYLGLGENGRKAVVDKLRSAQFPIFKEFGKLLGQGAKGVGRGIGSLLGGYSRFTARNPLGSFALLGLGLFGANRFNRVYNGDEQDDFFRKTTSPPTGGH